LDRPGGRFFLGKIATFVVNRGGGDGIQISYMDGFWTRRIGSDFFPDSVRFDYEYADFERWKHQMEQYVADTEEYWLQHYRPKQGDVIVDVGAGRGEDTVTFSRAVGDRGRVIAIEAHPSSFAILKRFCQLNRLENVTLLELALMDNPGTVRIAESEMSWMENAIELDEGSSGIKVPAETLEAVCREQGLAEIAFLKMNIEGAERYALPGSRSVLPQIRQICVACHDFLSDRSGVGKFRTREFVEDFLGKHGFVPTSRADDPRDWVRDHIFGLRHDAVGTTRRTATPLISVLITTYNYGRFIEEAIDSVLSQDFPLDQVEIIVVDDGSTDETAVRVKKYGSRVRYFYQSNRGQAAALNLGFAKARGEIISLLDADDYFLPGKLSRVAEAFCGDAALGMFYHPFLEFDMETKKERVSRFPLVSGSPFTDLAKFSSYVGPGTSVSFRRQFLRKLFPIPEEIRMLADGYIGSLIIFVAPILATSECLAAYRFHDKNCFHAEDGQISIETRQKRVRFFQIEIAAMSRWFSANRYTRREPAVRMFLGSMNQILRKEEFSINPPGRFRFFYFVVKQNWANSPIQTKKWTILNYLASPLALIFGYRRAQAMYEARGRITTTAERLFRALRARSSGAPPVETSGR
jgi:FkbM family methyltransferase